MKTKNAEKIRTLRGRPRKDRQEAGRSLRDLPAGDEAQAKRKAKGKVVNTSSPKVVLMGNHYKVAHPALQWERDDLLDKLFKAQDQAEAWKDAEKYAFNSYNRHSYLEHKRKHTKKMMDLFNQYIEDLKKRLLSLDERISPIHDEY